MSGSCSPPVSPAGLLGSSARPHPLHPHPAHRRRCQGFGDSQKGRILASNCSRLNPSATTYYLGARQQVTSFAPLSLFICDAGDIWDAVLPPPTSVATGLDAVTRRALGTAPPGAHSLQAALLSFKSREDRGWQQVGTQKSFLPPLPPPHVLAKVEPQGGILTCALLALCPQREKGTWDRGPQACGDGNGGLGVTRLLPS